jgi:hypothetical protein
VTEGFAYPGIGKLPMQQTTYLCSYYYICTTIYVSSCYYGCVLRYRQGAYAAEKRWHVGVLECRG